MRLRTLFLVALSLAALVGGLWYWRKTEAASARRLHAWESQQRIEATAAVLQRQMDGPAQTLPLVDFAELIAKNSGLTVEIERLALDVEGKDLASIWIDVPRGTLSIGSVLRLGLSPHGLCYDIEERRLTITTPTVSRDRTRLRAVVYPLPQPELASSEVYEGMWQDIAVRFVAEGEWDATGGDGYCASVPGGLVIVHTPDVHRQVRHLLESLSRMVSQPESLAPVPLLPPMSSDARNHIRAAVKKPAAIDFHDVPLRKAVSELAWQHNVPIVVNATELIEAGVDPDQKITIHSDSRSLESLLRRMLDTLEITFMVRDDAVVVTTHEDAESSENMATVAYPVHDLVAVQGGRDYDPLIDLITTTIAPEKWQDGSGPMRSVAEFDGRLLISQTWDVHAEIEQLLSQLRRSLSYDQDQSAAEGRDDEARAPDKMVIRTHDVRPLTDPDVGIFDERQLEEFLTGMVAYEYWNGHGGPGALRTFRGLAVIGQTVKRHDQIERLLAAVERHCLRQPQADGERPWVIDFEADPAAERMEEQLTQLLKIEFDEKTIQAAIARISEHTQVPIHIDNECLPDTLVPTLPLAMLRAPDLTLAGTLDRILRPRGMGYVAGPGRLTVVHLEDVVRHRLPRLYRVDDLLDEARDVESIAALIQDQTDPSAWMRRGGAPGLNVTRPLASGWIGVSADSRQHERVADVLREMRTGVLPPRERERRELDKQLGEWNELRNQREAAEFLKRPDAPPADPFAESQPCKP
jgi:hypothetical protein